MSRIGIDLGGTKTEGIILTDNLEPIERKRIPTPQNDYNAILNGRRGQLTPPPGSHRRLGGLRRVVLPGHVARLAEQAPGGGQLGRAINSNNAPSSLERGV